MLLNIIQYIKNLKHRTKMDNKTVLKLSVDDAKKLYPTATSEFKQMLESSFGKETFFEKITDRIKTLSDVFAVIKPSKEEFDLINYVGSNRRIIGAKHLMIIEMIAEVLNEGWQADWTNSRQYKYYPWFKYTSGFGFSCSGYGDWDASSRCGSRLCFKSAELAEYAGSQFQEVYQQFLNK